MEHLLDKEPDIVFLTETWLQSEKNWITAEVKTYGYALLHEIRQKERGKERGGGVGVLVKQHLKAKQIAVKQNITFSQRWMIPTCWITWTNW